MHIDHRLLAVNGIELSLYSAGPATGRPVWLLHGFPECWHSWRQQIAPLAAAGYRVLIPEMRGYGRTCSPPEITDYDLLTLCGDIQQAMRQLASIGKQASAALEQTTLLMRNANGLLNNNGKQMFGSAEQAMKSLEQSTATINALLTNNQEALGNGMQGLNSLAPAIRELRDTLGSLRAISRRLESNPSGYLLGHETDKEFTP
mgnify:CR=1 FL=1